MSAVIARPYICLLAVLVALIAAPASWAGRTPQSTTESAINKLSGITADAEQFLLDMGTDIDVAFDRAIAQNQSENNFYKIYDKFTKKIGKKTFAMARQIDKTQTQTLRLLDRAGADQSLVDAVNAAASDAHYALENAGDQLYGQAWIRLFSALGKGS